MLLIKLVSIFDRTIGLMAGAAGVVLIFVFLSVCAEVVMRYFLNRPLLWTVDIAEESLLYITFLGTAWVLKREGHVKMEVVVSRLSPRVQCWLGIVSSAMGIAICCVFVWYGAQVTWDQWVRGISTQTTSLDAPTAYYLVVIPIGSLLLLIQFIRRTRNYFGGFKASPEPQQRL